MQLFIQLLTIGAVYYSITASRYDCIVVLLHYCLLQYYITAYFLHAHVLLQFDYNELLDYLLSCLLNCLMDCPLARFEPPRKHTPADTLGKPKMRHTHQVRSLHRKNAACTYKQGVMVGSVGGPR